MYAETYDSQGNVTITPETARPVAELIARAAEKRWEVGSGGVTVTLPGGGSLAIPSDDTAYGRLKGAAQDLAAGIITEPLTIVIGALVMTVDQATATALYGAISQHWQACFAVQGAVVTAINAGTITTFAEIEAAAWPSNG